MAPTHAIVNGGRCGNLLAKPCLHPHNKPEREEPRGMMGTLYEALQLILQVVWFVMIVHIIMSWLINFQVLNLRQPLVAQLWDGLNRLLEPLYRPIRNVLPSTGGLDLAPLVLFIIIIILQRALANNAGFFYGM